jgi:TRAP-type C4-dicarboxylate transport system permease small subunit
MNTPAAGHETPRSWLARIDDAVYFVEKGIVTTALLALALSYFLDIVHVEAMSADNALDRLIYRFAGYGSFERPDEAFRQMVQTWISPPVLFLFTFGLAWLAVAVRDPEGRLGAGPRALRSLGTVAVLFALTEAIIHVPSRWVTAATILLVLGAYGVRAYKKGELGRFVALWIPGSAPFVWLVWTMGPGYSWAQDLGKVLIMWVGFVGASMATREQKHIRIDFIRKALPPRLRSRYNAVSHFVTLTFCGLLGVLSIDYLQVQMRVGGDLSALRLPAWWIVLPIALSLVVMFARFSARFVVALRGGEAGLGEGASH